MSKDKSRFLQRLGAGFLGKKATLAAAVFAVIAPIVTFACRIVFVFVNDVVFVGFSEILLGIMLINAAFLAVLAYLKVTGKDVFRRRTIRIIYKVSLALTFFFTLISIAPIAISPEDGYVYAYYITEMLPYLAVFFGAVFLIFIFPRIKKARAVVAALLITVISVTLLITGTAMYSIGFTADPFVLDTGEGYRIIWATNTKSVGWVEYTYQGEDYKIYHSSVGRKAAERIHKADIPYEHLDSNSYTVHSQRVIDELGYGGYSGAVISSGQYNFKGGTKDDMVIWSLSDWHCNDQAVMAATQYMDKPDVVILLGDYVNAMYRERDIAEFIIAPAAAITGGECPVIFARGNHETRGKYARELGLAFGLDTYYNDISRGDYRFIVLDTNEDKPDSHIEYGGMVDFESYRREQGLWLNSLAKGEEKYVIAVAHDPGLSIDEEQSAEWTNELVRLGADLKLSGHLHISEIRAEEEIFTIIDGGRTTKVINGRKKLVFVGTQISISGSSMTIKAVDNRGNIYIDETHSIG